MFKVGDMARLNMTFSLIEKHGDTVYDHSEDLATFVRGDVVEILKVIEHDGDTLVAIYSYTIKESTVINVSRLDPLKGEIVSNDIGQTIALPIRVEGAKEAAAKIGDALKSMKIEVGDPKVSEKGQLGTDDMRIVGGTIKASHIHTGGMIHGGIKLSF
ncbi:Uncharacterized protein BCRIVMBC845_06414 [Bacillus cereus]|nr:Uncharacterized protein BCRIVMBC845_06414 [Bacillus cereus]